MIAGLLDNQIKESGMTVLYVFIPSTWTVNKTIYAKYFKQKLLLEDMAKMAGVSYDYAKSLAKDGIIAKTGKDPVTNLKEALSTSVSGIGDPVTILAIISAVAAVLPALLSLLKTLGITKSDPDIQTTIPADTDFTDTSKTSLSPSSSSSITTANISWLIGAGLLATLLFSANKNEKGERK